MSLPLLLHPAPLLLSAPNLYAHLPLALTIKPHSPRVSPTAVPSFSICQGTAHPSRGSSNVPSSMKACPALPDRITYSLPHVLKEFSLYPPSTGTIMILMYSPRRSIPSTIYKLRSRPCTCFCTLPWIPTSMMSFHASPPMALPSRQGSVLSTSTWEILNKLFVPLNSTHN